MSDKMKSKSKPAAALMTNADTVRLDRVFATKPEKVYRALFNADRIAKRLPPYGFTCHVEHMEANVGGPFPNVVRERHDAEGPFVRRRV